MLPIVIVAAAVLGGVVMLLWNAVIPLAFTGARPLDYPHALGLLVLCKLLFGGFGGRRGGHRWRHGGPWRDMTAEERDRLRQTMRHARREERPE